MTLPFARSIGSDPTKTAPNQLAPTQGGQLEGTLTGATPGGQGKTLPAATGIEGSSAAFSSLMRQLQQSVIRAQPSAMDKLRNFRATTGLEAMTTGAITGAIGAGEKERLEGITETFRTTIDLMKEQEDRKDKQRQENLRWGEMLFKSVENPLNVFSGDDIENMKLGIMTPEMKQKLATVKPKEEKTSFIREYEFAKAQGFKGTLLQYEAAKRVAGREPKGEDDEKKLIKNFQNDAADMILKLDNKQVSWGSAFDNLRIKYPQISNETINATLGGGIPFDSRTGIFDTSKAFGRAKRK